VQRYSPSDELSASQIREMGEALLRFSENSDGQASLDRLSILQQVLGYDLARRLGIYRIPEGFRLSVVIPVYNERRTIEAVIERVRFTGIPLEIIIVDDGSRDGTRDLLAEWRDGGDPRNSDLKIVFHERNQGKGGALRTGFGHCTGDAVIIQDADLEYDPADYLALIQPIVEGRADVVYGSRFSEHDGPVLHYWHRWGNQLITRLSNWRSGLSFSDVETCYKVVRRELLQQISPTLQERGFGIEIELTQKLARVPGVRFFERPVSDEGRSYAEGKKIGWRDGVWALWCILRY
jgi:glycosyltransferase involved in cell wall biosynthesis